MEITDKVLNIISAEIKTKLKRCQSSNVVAYGYYEPKQLIWVLFKNGSIYSYNQQTPQAFQELEAAESKGKWINANLVKNSGLEVHGFTINKSLLQSQS